MLKDIFRSIKNTYFYHDNLEKLAISKMEKLQNITLFSDSQKKANNYQLHVKKTHLTGMLKQ